METAKLYELYRIYIGIMAGGVAFRGSGPHGMAAYRTQSALKPGTQSAS